jgi:hypothetical protein
LVARGTRGEGPFYRQDGLRRVDTKQVILGLQDSIEVRARKLNTLFNAWNREMEGLSLARGDHREVTLPVENLKGPAPECDGREDRSLRANLEQAPGVRQLYSDDLAFAPNLHASGD